MERIITIIKDGEKTTRLGIDAAGCLEKIKLTRQAHLPTVFTTDVIRKLHMVRLGKKLAA